MHLLIAQKVRLQPELIDHAIKTLERWQLTASHEEMPILNEWKSLLEGDLNHLLEWMVNPGQEATRLRQSSPFAGRRFISDRERLAIFKEFRESISA
jgi:hypothetical protein